MTAENRTYDGTSGVNIDSVQLIGTLPTDSVTASATGAMLNSDAGDNKTVYAKVTLDGNWGEVYALDTESVQTTVDIKKALITGIKITAQDKKYSKTDDALVRVDEITGVLAMDASLVRVSGEAKFDTASAGDNKTVTFIATELTGRKAANYEFESPDAMQAMAEASITPLNVTFTLGALTFGYDTDEKPVTVSAFDETGAVFTDYDIVYRDADGNDLGFVPKDAGSYLVGIEITDSNYVTDYTDKEMFIIEADREALSILGLPGTVAFGDENPELELTGLFVGDEASYESVLKKMFTVSCEADEKSPVGEYSIKVTLNEGYTLKDDKNYNFTIGEDGIITVKKAVLTVTVSDIERTYGVATPDPEYKITGFKAGDTGKVVTGTPVFTFKEGTDGSANAGMPAQ